MVIASPLLPTDVAELITTAAGDMIASLALLYHILAAGALPVVQIILEEIHFVLVAFAFVHLEKALGAKDLVAFITCDRLAVMCEFQDAVLAFLLGAKLEVGVLGCHIECVQLRVLFLNVSRQGRVKCRLGAENQVTLLVGADDLFEHAHFVDDIVLETGVAVVVTAISDPRLLILLVLHLADPTQESRCIPYFSEPRQHCLGHLRLGDFGFPATGTHFHRFANGLGQFEPCSLREFLLCL